MSASTKLVIGTVLFLLFGIWVVHFSGTVTRVETAVYRSAEAELRRQNASWASISVDGQTVVLSGRSPSEKERQVLIAGLQNAGRQGGNFTVNSRLVQISPPALPAKFEWRAELQNGALRITGNTSSPESKALIQSLSEAQFPNAAITDETIAVALPNEGSWLVSASISLRALALLDEGEAVNIASEFFLRGRTSSASNARTAQMLMESLPEEFVASSIEIEAPDVAKRRAQTSTEPEAIISVVTPEMIAHVCQQEIDELLGGKPITFQSRSLIIDPARREALTQVAQALSRCGNIVAYIEGHSDSSGRENRNISLSEERAEEVASFLLNAGAPQEKIEPRGHGSAQPIRPNTSSAGRAANRRVEIKVHSKPSE